MGTPPLVNSIVLAQQRVNTDRPAPADHAWPAAVLC
jgi:hypothetical protein